MKVDAHQHFWQPLRGDYHWMPKDNAILNRSYAPSDLRALLDKKGIDGTVVVQAAATLNETEYMLGLADATPFIKGVVGWIDFENPKDLVHLQRLAHHPKFLGVRPMIQDIPDIHWVLRDDVQWAFRAILDLDLTFDALGLPQHLSNFHELACRYPEIRVVYDHCMKPQICRQQAGEDVFTQWADGMSQLAENSAACCKLSGLVTEANEQWNIDDIRPFSDHVLKAFGSERVMWGSDWPVCLLQAGYDDWHTIARQLTSHLSEQERDSIFGHTAVRFYRL